jgi:hypothetical protein
MLLGRLSALLPQDTNLNPIAGRRNPLFNATADASTDITVVTFIVDTKLLMRVDLGDRSVPRRVSFISGDAWDPFMTLRSELCCSRASTIMNFEISFAG